MPDKDRRSRADAAESNGAATTGHEGIDWPLGQASDVEWITAGTTTGLEITSGIPPVFDAYATLVLPEPGDHDGQQRHDRAVIEVLTAHSGEPPWWLGYLETGQSDVVFPDAPRVGVYHADWRYVLVQAGPGQALAWREPDHWKGHLPDLIFPRDRSWLFSTLWDDDWSCLGGPKRLIDGVLANPELGPRARAVALGDDATPPGHIAF
ncbi:MAG TPA: hypothetical protein VNV44_09795 [Solirubrobacteraceae bacterium]|nr:hypothetical protein [Solirubrobacteraceae bacterium]HXB16020.1 hypothetical protein [Solirubrobacteraceae bacterium]